LPALPALHQTVLHGRLVGRHPLYSTLPQTSSLEHIAGIISSTAYTYTYSVKQVLSYWQAGGCDTLPTQRLV
jgi:hypothetical protein